jgi:hypothetical protein
MLSGLHRSHTPDTMFHTTPVPQSWPTHIARSIPSRPNWACPTRRARARSFVAGVNGFAHVIARRGHSFAIVQAEGTFCGCPSLAFFRATASGHPLTHHPQPPPLLQPAAGGPSTQGWAGLSKELSFHALSIGSDRAQSDDEKQKPSPYKLDKVVTESEYLKSRCQ